MPIHLDPDTEARIQQGVDRGHYHSPDELLNKALDLLGVEPQWTEADKRELDARIAESEACFARGEFYTAEEVVRILGRRRAGRVRNAS